FHPGVWVKNFALNGLGQRHGLTPVNLIIDNDAVRTTVLRLPARTPRPHVWSVPIDHWREEVPYEERAVVDEAVLASLPERVAEGTAAWPGPPPLGGFWRVGGAQ